jgi:aspartate-semialdehyde dehydrogenase
LDMTKRSILLLCFAVISSGLAFSATPSFAQKKTVKACQEEWRANKAANEAAKITEKDYVAKCRTAATTTTAPAAPAPAAAPKTAAKKPADPQEAEHARERACGADWKAEKAAGKVPAGMTWPKYWSECDKRKKAAGM